MPSQTKHSIAVLVAAIALMASVGAATAGATEFHAETSPITLSGAQTEAITFTTEAGSVECSEASFEGELSESTTTELELSPSFAGCEAFGFSLAHINMTGCTFKVTWTTTLHLLCPAGKGIDITPTFLGSSVCTVTFTPFTRNVAAIATTVALKKWLHVLLGLASLPIDVSGGICGESGETGEIGGKFTIEGFSEEEQVDLWIE